MVIAAKTDQNLFSLHITNILSSTHVKRKKEIHQLGAVSLSTSKFFKIKFKLMYNDQWGEFSSLVRNFVVEVKSV